MSDDMKSVLAVWIPRAALIASLIFTLLGVAGNTDWANSSSYTAPFMDSDANIDIAFKLYELGQCAESETPIVTGMAIKKLCLFGSGEEFQESCMTALASEELCSGWAAVGPPLEAVAGLVCTGFGFICARLLLLPVVAAVRKNLCPNLWFTPELLLELPAILFILIGLAVFDSNILKGVFNTLQGDAAEVLVVNASLGFVNTCLGCGALMLVPLTRGISGYMGWTKPRAAGPGAAQTFDKFDDAESVVPNTSGSQAPPSPAVDPEDQWGEAPKKYGNNDDDAWN